ncbi:MAG: tetratricopeptide repeat protein [Terriglobales bacterium]
MSKRRITTICIVLLVLSMTGAALVLRRMNQLRADAPLKEVLYVPSARVLKGLSLGYNGLLADIYWTRVVQYFGSHHHANDSRYELLAPLLDITTELDPHLIVAYQFGGTFLSQPPPQGAGDPDAAARLVERGIRYNPSDWRLYYNLGFIHYWERKDYAAAADAFLRGSRVAGAQPWLKVMAAAMAQHASDINTARFLWTKLYETSNEKWLRANAVNHLAALQVDEDITNLEAAIQSYREETGRVPSSLTQLQAAGWRGRAVDPLGYPYRIESDGTVRVQHPEGLPFITKGLPPGQAPNMLGPVRMQTSPAAVPQSH